MQYPYPELLFLAFNCVVFRRYSLLENAEARNLTWILFSVVSEKMVQISDFLN